MIKREVTHDFGIVTRSRDIGESRDYPGIVKGRWIQQAGYRAAYLGSVVTLPFAVPHLWRRFSPDTLYLTSIHDVSFAWIPLLMCRLRMLRPSKIVIAPTGEFSEAALTHHRNRKRWAKALMRWLLHQRLSWHVSSNQEAEDVLTWWKGALPEFQELVVQPDVGLAPSEVVSTGSGRRPRTVVFASRIHPMKGLLETVDLLRRCEAPCTFRIYGAIEDARYWQEVQSCAEHLPLHVTFEYAGGYSPEQVSGILGRADLFILLTRGEGFGHAISESLALGCPTLISTKSMWTSLVNDNGGLASDSDDERLSFLRAILEESDELAQARRERILNGYTDWYKSVLSIPGPFQNS